MDAETNGWMGYPYLQIFSPPLATGRAVARRFPQHLTQLGESLFEIIDGNFELLHGVSPLCLSRDEIGWTPYLAIARDKLIQAVNSGNVTDILELVGYLIQLLGNGTEHLEATECGFLAGSPIRAILHSRLRGRGGG